MLDIAAMYITVLELPMRVLMESGFNALDYLEWDQSLKAHEEYEVNGSPAELTF